MEVIEGNPSRGASSRSTGGLFCRSVPGVGVVSVSRVVDSRNEQVTKLGRWGGG
jgi:hypothetical protein